VEQVGRLVGDVGVALPARERLVQVVTPMVGDPVVSTPLAELGRLTPARLGQLDGSRPFGANDWTLCRGPMARSVA
jgi:hypothetical protein